MISRFWKVEFNFSPRQLLMRPAIKVLWPEWHSHGCSNAAGAGDRHEMHRNGKFAGTLGKIPLATGHGRPAPFLVISQHRRPVKPWSVPC